MPGSKSRGHFRKTPKKVVVVPATKRRTHMEKDKPMGPPPPPKTGADEPPAEGARESPLGPGEHRDDAPADAPKE